MSDTLKATKEFKGEPNSVIKNGHFRAANAIKELSWIGSLVTEVEPASITGNFQDRQVEDMQNSSVQRGGKQSMEKGRLEEKYVTFLSKI